MSVAPEVPGTRDRIPMPQYRLGIDLVEIDEVDEALAVRGERYLARLFTEQEVASCRGKMGLRAASLAGRFAAKEAAVKALRPTGCRPPWRDIEVVRGRNGSCELWLHGRAAALASAQGIDRLAVSMSHEAGMAIAVVAGWSCTASDQTPAFSEPPAVGGTRSPGETRSPREHRP